MGKKERILKLIKENDGLTYVTLERKYNEKFGANEFNTNTGYVFLKRLKKAGLIENDKGINVLYKTTPKALANEPDSLEFLKGLFEEGKVKVYRNKLKQEDIEKLKVI